MNKFDVWLQTILRNIDSLLYVDSDVVFLSPVEQIWNFFDRMNSSQMAAMAPKSEEFASSWYYRFAKHPYVERLGVNSGVMLMNLTRMRAFQWHNFWEPYLSQYKLSIVWAMRTSLILYFIFIAVRLQNNSFIFLINFYFEIF
jgi:UDP-xylose:glucoside alpha-1,3-xylosyltransferase